ncbi:MAG: SMI1/KNR4 family protein [Myxococcota bacterium]
MRSVLADFERVLPLEVSDGLAPPASEVELDDAQARLGVLLDPAHRALLTWHDGGKPGPERRRRMIELVPRFRLLSATELPGHHDALRAGLPEWAGFTPFCAHRTAPAWLAFAEPGHPMHGRVVMIDVHAIDFPSYASAFDDVRAMLQTVVQAIEEGAIVFDGGTMQRGAGFRDIAARRNPQCTIWSA